MSKSCPTDRDQVIILLKAICIAQSDLYKILAADKDWSKGLFPGALFMDDDPRFFAWLEDLCQSIHLPIKEVYRTDT